MQLWFLDGSLQYLYLDADNLIAINHGHTAGVGKLGLECLF